VKIRSVTVNSRKNQVELVVRSGKVYPVTLSRLDPRPTADDRVREVYVEVVPAHSTHVRIQWAGVVMNDMKNSAATA
jgi:hypothetical protein